MVDSQIKSTEAVYLLTKLFLQEKSFFLFRLKKAVAYLPHFQKLRIQEIQSMEGRKLPQGYKIS
jgi:hypothetical protein